MTKLVSLFACYYFISNKLKIAQSLCMLFVSAFYQLFWKPAVRYPGLYPHKRQVDQTVADRLAVNSPDTSAEKQAQEQNELVCTSTLLTAFSNPSKYLKISFASPSQIHYGYVKY